MSLQVTVVGVGCDRCHKLAENAQQALAEVGRPDVSVNRVADLEAVADLGVLLTPALIVNDLVLSSGRVLSAQKVAGQLRRMGAAAEG